jgi:hypothetical protein
MANLQLVQCDLCGFAEFNTYGSLGFLKGGLLRFNVDGCEMRICEHCIGQLLERKGKYELTGAAAKPCRPNPHWGPAREQTGD